VNKEGIIKRDRRRKTNRKKTARKRRVRRDVLEKCVSRKKRRSDPATEGVRNLSNMKLGGRVEMLPIGEQTRKQGGVAC